MNRVELQKCLGGGAPLNFGLTYLLFIIGVLAIFFIAVFVIINAKIEALGEKLNETQKTVVAKFDRLENATNKKLDDVPNAQNIQLAILQDIQRKISK